MLQTLEAAKRAAGREISELTRRDLARALLASPPGEALAALAELRTELAGEGNPLSDSFWDSAGQTLLSIQEGTATVGDVHRWLEATGAEPTSMILSEGFLWPDEEERGPVATEMYDGLVAHLESLVAAGTIDPDRLVAGEQAALADYQRIQVEWLRTPLPDGRLPGQAVQDEVDDEFLAAWDSAEADARQELERALAELEPRPCPEAELRAACARLRNELGSGAGAQGSAAHQVLRTSARLDPARLPGDDRELWLALAAGVVAPWDAPPEGALDEESHAAWMTLDHWDWTGAALSLARQGPGTAVDAAGLAHAAASFEPAFDDLDDDEDGIDDEAIDDEAIDDEAIDDEDSDDEDSEEALSADEDLFLGAPGPEDEAVLEHGFHTPILLWRALGVLDPEDRLTELGWWGVPESLLLAWQPADEKA